VEQADGEHSAAHAGFPDLEAMGELSISQMLREGGNRASIADGRALSPSQPRSRATGQRRAAPSRSTSAAASINRFDRSLSAVWRERCGSLASAGDHGRRARCCGL